MTKEVSQPKLPELTLPFSSVDQWIKGVRDLAEAHGLGESAALSNKVRSGEVITSVEARYYCSQQSARYAHDLELQDAQLEPVVPWWEGGSDYVKAQGTYNRLSNGQPDVSLQTSSDGDLISNNPMLVEAFNNGLVGEPNIINKTESGGFFRASKQVPHFVMVPLISRNYNHQFIFFSGSGTYIVGKDTNNDLTQLIDEQAKEVIQEEMSFRVQNAVHVVKNHQRLEEAVKEVG